jgi:uncharacterized protein
VNRWLGRLFFLILGPFFLLYPSSGQSSSTTGTAFHPTVEQLDALSGRYQNAAQPDNTLNIYRAGEMLIYETERQVPTELIPQSVDDVSVAGSDTHFHFTLAPDGHANQVSFLKANYVRIGEPIQHHFRPYSRQEAMIPMRDGVKLHVVIVRPTDTNDSLPILIDRTPYGADRLNPITVHSLRTELAASGYIFVGADIRGRYKSEGIFVMCRPLADHRDKKAIDESTDTWDTIEWLIKNVPNNNGRAGVLGTSYDGFLAMMAGIDPHPALKAISPQAPMIDTWMGDDFFHNGAFRQTYGYDYVLGMESSKETTFGKLNEDAYDFFLNNGSFAGVAKASGISDLPTWKDFFLHPSYDRVWHSRGVEYHLNTPTVPTLTVGGYYDQEDMWGPQEEYASLEARDSKGENFLVLAPWRHGQWSASLRNIGALKYGAPISDQYRVEIEAPFFAHYLKGEPGFNLTDTASFQTGSNTWLRYSHWPPVESKPRNLYLSENGQLSFSLAQVHGQTTYLSDPKKPIPYRNRPIQATYAPGSKWRDWMAEDQRFVADRKDHAVWLTSLLDGDLTITGDVVADLFASTTGTDSDWIVKLIDVYPEDDPDPNMRGYQLLINAEIFRGRYLKSFDKPSPLDAGKSYEYKFSLHGADHVFRKGHRVMVEVQSTWFPLYDRNPQKYVSNIMMAKPDDYQAATQTIYSDPKHPSHLVLPVMGQAPDF